jgi:hypothetical protein
VSPPGSVIIDTTAFPVLGTAFSVVGIAFPAPGTGGKSATAEREIAGREMADGAMAERGRTEVSWVPPAGNDGVAGKDGAFEPTAGAADAVSTVSEMGVVATTSKKAAAQIRTQTARPINDACIQTIGCPTTTGCPLPTVFIILSLPCVSIDSDLPACLLPSSHP